MAFFSDIVFDKDTRRHRLEFVNQQFDYLMGIEFDDVLGQYKLTVPLEEARKISKSWAGRDFDLAYWLGVANKELPEQDKKIPNGPPEKS
jgi:hypothetical protein